MISLMPDREEMEAQRLKETMRARSREKVEALRQQLLKKCSEAIAEQRERNRRMRQ